MDEINKQLSDLGFSPEEISKQLVSMGISLDEIAKKFASLSLPGILLAATFTTFGGTGLIVTLATALSGSIGVIGDGLTGYGIEIILATFYVERSKTEILDNLLKEIDKGISNRGARAGIIITEVGEGKDLDPFDFFGFHLVLFDSV